MSLKEDANKKTGLMSKVDFAVVNQNADLLKLCGGGLRKAASSGGGEWAGACPMCGGKDRFHIQPYHRPQPRWLCRKCSGGAWRGAVDFVMLRDGVGAGEAADRIQGAVRYEQAGVGEPEEVSRYQRSGDAGGREGGAGGRGKLEGALPGIEQAIRALWGGSKCGEGAGRMGGRAALDWLKERGLREATVRYFLIGWSSGIRAGGVRLPEGVLIPWFDGEELCSVKVALLPGQRVRCSGCGGTTTAREECGRCGRVNKYSGVRGSRAGLFNAVEMEVECGRPICFVEGEFDCMLGWQCLRERIAFVTLGSSAARLDLLRYGPALVQGRRLYTLYDNDEAGQNGCQRLSEQLGGMVRHFWLPEGSKDLSEYVLGGGELGAVFEGAG